MKHYFIDDLNVDLRRNENKIVWMRALPWVSLN